MGSSGKYILMNDIDLSGVEWTAKTLNAGAEFNGNGYTISNLNGSRGLLGNNNGTVKNTNISNATIVGTGGIGILVGTNTVSGTIENCSVSGNVMTGHSSGCLVGYNSGLVKNSNATGTIVSNASYVGGLVGYNNSATARIENSSANVSVTAHSTVGGLIGRNDGGVIKNSNATGSVTANGGSYNAGGFIGWCNGGSIDNSYALGNVNSTNLIGSGGFAGQFDNATITNCYAKGDVNNETSYMAGGFASAASGITTVINCYSTGNVSAATTPSHSGGFIGRAADTVNVSNCYSTGIVIQNGASIFSGGKANITNCYANSEQPAGVNINQAGVIAMPASWFEDGQNLMFLGDAYDYYYNPPELWGNGEEHPEEFTQFQVGANSGEKNQLDLNLTFRMYNFYGDVSSVDNASDTLERVDAFKERLSEHRSMIGAVRNRLDSVMESQSIRLENLNSSHSTIVDTDFAAETAKLTRNQILQQATTSLLAQANTLPSLALQLLS